MTLAVVARFSDLTEAQVACAVLRSAGFGAVMFDDGLASVDPFFQRAMGGTRVCVPEDELAAALDILAEAQSAGDEQPSDIESPPHTPGWTAAALAAGVLASAPAGLAVDGFRRRPSLLRLSGLVLIFGMMGLALAAMAYGMFA